MLPSAIINNATLYFADADNASLTSLGDISVTDRIHRTGQRQSNLWRRIFISSRKRIGINRYHYTIGSGDLSFYYLCK